MPKILLVEDDASLSDSLKQVLTADKYTVDAIIDGAVAEEYLKIYTYQLVILDWDLPSVSGIEILRNFRMRGGVTPILILTGKSSLSEKEEGLDAGADDYLTKPFHPRELRARLRALLRRSPQLLGDHLKAKNIELDVANKEVKRDGIIVRMTPLEVDVLEFFMRHPGEVFSIEALIHGVWASDGDISDAAIYTVIKKLRRKLDTEDQPSIISNVHSLGYKLEK